MADWGAGSYELMAPEIEPVAVEVIDAAEPVEGLKVLDLACGNGNATLVAAQRGAHTVGFDAAPRLLELAAKRAEDAGLSIDWMQGDIHELPFPGESFDVVTSVFGVIFASDPSTTVSEIGRVLNHQGRFAISTWTDEGALAAVAAIWRGAVSEALPPGQDPPEMFDWGDANAVTELFAEHGLAAHVERHSIEFRHETPDHMVDAWSAGHPMWLAIKPLLGEEGYAAAVEKSRAKVTELNEGDRELRITSSYLVISGSPV